MEEIECRNIYKYKSDFDYYEIYDENKEYKNDEYEANYGKGVRKYKNYLLTSKRSSIKYVVSSEVVSDKEILFLRDYCQCQACKTPFWDLSKYLYCRCCIGCLWSGGYTISVVDETREYVDNNVMIY